MSNFVAALLGIGSLVVVYFWIRLLIKIFKWVMNMVNPPDLPDGEEE